MRDGFQYLTLMQQIQHFAGCVYVPYLKKVAIPTDKVPDGLWVDPKNVINGMAVLTDSEFESIYGGYIFVLDEYNDKLTKSARKAFVESAGIVWPRVNLSMHPLPHIT